MKSKIHRATVTTADLHYEGSITIDEKLMEKACVIAYEKVDVYNCENGKRFSTYIIPGKIPGVIGLNGPAARKALPGDKVIIVSYAQMTKEEATGFCPKVLFVDSQNRPRP